jgi:hypothetical protein
MTFIHIPKTGGNTITNWMRDNFDIEVSKRKQHADVAVAQERFGNLGWTFCVVRNPWDYMVSWYTFKIYLCNAYIKNINEMPDKIVPEKEKWNLEIQKEKLKKLEQGFEPWLIQTGVVEQHRWAKNCNYVMKIENLNEDFKKVQERLNCFVPLGFANKTPNRSRYQDYYNSKTKDIVYQNYKEDVTTYNYEF